jgi:hypothetical protein
MGAGLSGYPRVEPRQVGREWVEVGAETGLVRAKVERLPLAVNGLGKRGGEGWSGLLPAWGTEV